MKRAGPELTFEPEVGLWPHIVIRHVLVVVIDNDDGWDRDVGFLLILFVLLIQNSDRLHILESRNTRKSRLIYHVALKFASIIGIVG
jgi:hypothetical protein